MRRLATHLTCALALTMGAALALPAGALTFDMTPQGDTGYGDLGLYLGDDDWSGQDQHWRNWEFVDVTMTIHADGDARIAGSMARVGDEMYYPEDDLLWGIEIELHSLEFKGSTFAGASGAYDGMMEDLMSMTEDGAGFEWDSLEMTVHMPDDLPYSTSVPETGWIGYAMPSMGHHNVAELHYDAERGGLSFDAWYRNPEEGNGWYSVGDSKADVTPAVPEPSAVALFGLGWLAVAGRSRRR